MTKGQMSGRGAKTWTRYKQGKLFKTQINDPTVQGCPKCLVLLAKIQEVSQQNVHMKWLDAILKFFIWQT